MTPKVSIIMPVYNTAEYLATALDTILLQTLSDIEVICIDDGSTDDSLSILQTYAMFDERVKIIQQENAGCGAARNRGIKEATGDFIIFLDSDDFFHPDMLQTMLETAEKENSDIVMCGHTIFDNTWEKDTAVCGIDPHYLKQAPIAPKDFPNDLFFCRGYLWEKLIKRSLIIDNDLMFTTDEVQSDLPFVYTAMALSEKISLLPDNFVHYRLNRSGQLTDKIQEKDHRFFVPWIRLYHHLKHYKLDNFINSYKTALFRELAWSLNDRDMDAKRQLLHYFNQDLPEEIKQLFGFGNNKAKISLIIPVYNGAEFLPECLDSTLNQTLKEIEIICVDDGSTDESLEILNQYAQKDSRIKVIHQENMGLPISRNNAIKLATGEYLQFLDADDYLEPDTCECLYLYSKIYSLDMLSFASLEFRNKDRIDFENLAHCVRWLPQKFTPVFTWNQIPNLLQYVTATAPLTIYRHQHLIDNDITWINKKITYEDIPFFTISLLKEARFGALSIKFYHKRVHENAITQNNARYFPDYCWIKEYTLDNIQKIIKNQQALSLYFYIFLKKTFHTFQDLDPDSKIKHAQLFYDFCFNLSKKYHLPLPRIIKEECYRFLNNNKKSHFKFDFYNLLANLKKKKYSITLISYQQAPYFLLNILGLPIISTTIKETTKDDKISYNVILKIFGLCIWKIKEIPQPKEVPLFQVFS